MLCDMLDALTEWLLVDVESVLVSGVWMLLVAGLRRSSVTMALRCCAAWRGGPKWLLEYGLGVCVDGTDDKVGREGPRGGCVEAEEDIGEGVWFSGRGGGEREGGEKGAEASRPGVRFRSR